MGASYGTLVSTVVESWTNPEVVPKPTDKPKHDTSMGFSNERTQRGNLLYKQYFELSFMNPRCSIKICFGFK